MIFHNWKIFSLIKFDGCIIVVAAKSGDYITLLQNRLLSAEGWIVEFSLMLALGVYLMDRSKSCKSMTQSLSA